MSLVTSNDTDPAERARDAAADGSGKNFGIMWRVNGEAIWSKGARTWGPPLPPWGLGLSNGPGEQGRPHRVQGGAVRREFQLGYQNM